MSFCFNDVISCGFFPQITFAIGFLVTVLVVTDVFGVDATHVRYILGLVCNVLSAHLNFSGPWENKSPLWQYVFFAT